MQQARFRDLVECLLKGEGAVERKYSWLKKFPPSDATDIRLYRQFPNESCELGSLHCGYEGGNDGKILLICLPSI